MSVFLYDLDVLSPSIPMYGFEILWKFFYVIDDYVLFIYLFIYFFIIII